MPAHALDAFDRDDCPGVPVRVFDGARFRDDDRVEWSVVHLGERPGASA